MSFFLKQKKTYILLRVDGTVLDDKELAKNEPRREKTGLRGFRPGPT